MPLMKGKSNKAFEHNVREEMHSGKPQNQALAISYNMKKRAGYAHGGEVNEKLHPAHEPMDAEMAAELVKHLMSSKKMSSGGMVGEEEGMTPSQENPAMWDDFLSDNAEDQMPHSEHMPDDEYREAESFSDGGEVEDEKMKRRKMIADAINSSKMSQK